MAVLARLSAAVRIAAGYVRQRYFHVVVQDSTLTRGFGMFGSRRPRAQFSRLYLGSRENTGARTVFHGGNCTRATRELSRRFGLALVTDVKVAGELERELIHMPAWIGMARDLPGSLADLRAGLSGSAKSDVNKVLNGGFNYVVRSDDAWIPEFHRRFHETGIASRHGDEGVVLTVEQLRAEMHEGKGEFLQIFKGGEWVAGLLARHEKQTYRLCRLGWRDGDAALHKAGVLAAVYWFAFDRGIALGAKRASFGGSPSFLEAGLTFFKAKWGASYDPAETWYGRQSLHLDPSHPHCREFFAERALVAFGAGGNELVVLSGMKPGQLKTPACAYSTVTRWFRLLPERMSESTPPPPLPIPVHLQPWFVEEPLPPKL